MYRSSPIRRPRRAAKLLPRLVGAGLLGAFVAAACLPTGPARADSAAPPAQGHVVGGQSRTAETADGGQYVPVQPERRLDTRSGLGASGPVAAGSTVELVVTGGASAVPADVSAVVLNVTVTDPAQPGFVTVWPCGSPMPTASNLNYVPGQTVPNLVVAKVGAGGKVCLSSLASAQLIADLNGYFPAGSSYIGVQPERRLDTRSGLGASGPVAAGSTVELVVTGGASAVPADVSAVVLNVTVTDPAQPGFVTVWPCGSPMPTASNLNYVPGQTVPNLVVAKVGAGGKVCLSSLASAQLIADLNGYFPAGSSYIGVQPERRLDTRSGLGASGPVAAGSTVELVVTGGASAVPADVSAVVLNVTVTDPAQPGFVTVWPCGSPMPTASNLNYVPGQTVPNLVVAKVGAGGKVCLSSLASAQLIADLNGYFPSHDAPGGGTVSGVDPTTGGDGGVVGAATGDGSAPPSGGGDDSYMPMTPVGKSGELPLPTAEQLAAAVAAVPAPEGQPVDEAGLSPQFISDNGYSEPNFPISSAGYTSNVDAAIGRIIMWDYTANGWQAVSNCSGTVIQQVLVLTAAHCMFHYGSTTEYDGFQFLSGLYGTTYKSSWFTQKRSYPTAYTTTTGLGRNLVDYAILTFDTPTSTGYYMGDYTGAFQVYMGLARYGLQKTTIGYPSEGFFGGNCNLQSCLPYTCVSDYTYDYAFAGAGDWHEVGWGCNASGGNSGSAVFSYYNGKWYVVSLTSNGGKIYDKNGYQQPYANRSQLWWFQNSWGPEFKVGWFDSLFNFALNL